MHTCIHINSEIHALMHAVFVRKNSKENAHCEENSSIFEVRMPVMYVLCQIKYFILHMEES